MKYIVNTRTKEHRVHTDEYFEDADVWRIVEADADGWITWEGGECPLPDGHKYNFATKNSPSRDINDVYARPEANAWKAGSSNRVTAYRPFIVAAEQEEPRRHGRTIVYIPESQKSVFDRLKSAVAASESIPAIIAEIDAMLPEGYCVVKRGAEQPAEHPAEGMTDWRNWKEGDLVTAHGLRGGYTENVFPENVPHTIVAKCLSGFDVKSSNGDVLYFNGREISRGELKFHSRPAKVAE